jgi:hypothetical protein
MKLLSNPKILFIFLTCVFFNCSAQVISTNRNAVGLEHNLLFNAANRYTVTQTGDAKIDLSSIFDGKFAPAYSNVGVSAANPTIITIEGLPGWHVQAGAWVGWSTRYWPVNHFKIEAYDVYYGNGWITVSDYSSTSYDGSDFYALMPQGAYSKLRITIYSGTGDGGKFGISELFFLHPEATTPYAGLFPVFTSISELNNNILIGKTSQTTSETKFRLDVNGPIRANEVVVNTNGADFVFDSTYSLRSLPELETFIKQNKHLPEMAPAKEMQENGVSAGEMQAKLLQKIEELTLYVIEMKKENEKLKNDKESQESELKQALINLEKRINSLENK